MTLNKFPHFMEGCSCIEILKHFVRCGESHVVCALVHFELAFRVFVVRYVGGLA